jgi:CheY-like chemotaxis protein
MGKTLLLADDSVTIQKVVGISFASEDITLVTVDNGDDAIARARAVKPDVILADVVMPGKSGYEVCEAIKSDPALRHIPVLLLTGTFEAFDNERASRAGAAGHIAKPFEAQALVERVKRLLAAPPPAPAVAPQAAPAPAAQPARPTPAPAKTVVALPPAPAPAPQSAPSSGADDAFEFFDDGATETAESPPSATNDSTLGSNAIDFDGGDNAFAFGDDELAASPPPASRASATAHTVAILPDAPADAPEEGLAFDPADGDADLELATPRPAMVSGDALDAADNYDFEFENGGDAARETGVEPMATVIDPIAGSAYDVSSSDLRTMVAPDATRLIDPEPAVGSARGGDEPVMGMLESDLDDGEAALEADPAEDSFAITQPRGIPAPAPPARPAAPPARPAAPAPRAPAPSPAPARAPLRDADATALAGDVLARVTPALREQLHETLEKIAWEAFGRAAENIVEQAVERLEKVAWEVVPRLAETLILEEIRKLKGDAQDD